MLMLKSPSLAINSHDVPGPNYRMWETVDAPPAMNAADVVHEIIRVNRLALEYERTQLLNVVINCHGADGGGALYVGGCSSDSEKAARINIGNVNVFSLLDRRNIGTIWLVACQAAAGNLGKQLCQQLAMVSKCQVIASDDDQSVGVWGTIRILQGGGRGQIDEFEGSVFSFTPVGGMREIDPHEAIYTILE